MQEKSQSQQVFMPLEQATISNHIHVSVRLKPLSETEQQYQRVRGGPQWQVVNDKTLVDRTGREYYHFDRVFSAEMNTQEIFDADILQMIQNALKGYNVTILAYGQTSSGKTHTISGTKQQPGLIELTANALYKELENLVQNERIDELAVPQSITAINFIQRTARIKICYLEIYNENVNDLLDINKRNLEVRENKN